MGRNKKQEPEIWRNIPEYKGKYQVSNCGRVRNVQTGTILKGAGAYNEHVSLYMNGKGRRTHTISSLVGRIFVGEAPEGCHYYHKNGIPTDHHARNIGIKTQRELFAKANNGKKRQIARIDRTGEIVAIYGSIREAARELPFTRAALRCRCDGYFIKYGRKYYNRSVFASDGYAYAWDDEESIQATLLRMEEELREETVIVDTSGYLGEIAAKDMTPPAEWLEVGGGGVLLEIWIGTQLLRLWRALIYKTKNGGITR